MGMLLPGELVWVMDMLGFEWPNLDEDEIHRAADLVRQYRDDLEDTIRWADRRINGDVATAMTNKAALAYSEAWNRNRSDNLDQLVELLGPVATGIDMFADAVLALKVKVAAEVAITAAQIAAAAASAVVTLGASAAATAAIIVARKKALDIMTDIAVEELMAQLLPMVITPLADDIPRLAMAALDAPLVEGAAGDVGQFQADLAALEQTAADLETNADDQERITEQFLADLSSLQIVGG